MKWPVVVAILVIVCYTVDAFSTSRSRQSIPRVSVEENARRLRQFISSTFVTNPPGVMSFPLPPQQYDMLFVIDSSGSIGSREFVKGKEFCKEYVNMLPSHVGRGATHIAAISYSTRRQIRTEFDFNRYSTKDAIIGAIDQISYQSGGSTNTAGALNKAKELFQRQGRPGKTKVLLLATDGRSNDGGNPVDVANALRSAYGDDIRILVIGVSQNINKAELEGIASHPQNDEILYVATYSQAYDVAQMAQNQ